MMSIVNSTRIGLKLLRNNLSKISLGNVPGQIELSRNKITISNPRLRNPSWFTRKNRTIHDDFITPENRNFIQEVVHERYGPPVIVNGVQTYRDCVSSLIKSDEDQPRPEWTSRSRRTGVIARKLGNYALWTKGGEKIDTTMLQIVDNHVIKYIPPNEFEPTQKPNVRNLKKFGCLLVGAESVDPTLLTKDYCGLFTKSGVMPKRILARFLITPDAALHPGTPINVGHFRVGSAVDVRGNTVYRGFQGVCRRHGFKGMGASHGVTKTHRRPGNIGGGGEKGRVWPGTRLPGHMGHRWRVARGLKVWRINTKYNVMWVSGTAIPGDTNGIVYIFDTMLPLRKPDHAPPFPTLYEDDSELTHQDIWSDDLHNFKKETIFYEVEK